VPKPRSTAPKEAREVAATVLFADLLGCEIVALKIDSQASRNSLRPNRQGGRMGLIRFDGQVACVDYAA